MMKKLLLPLLLSATVANGATVTMQFTSGSNFATNFAGNIGGGTAGLTYGIVVQGGASDLLASTIASDLNGVTLQNTSIAPTGTLLASGNSLFISTSLTSVVPNIPPAAGDANVAGSITSIANVDTGVIGNGSSYALVWFDTGIAAGDTLVDGNYFGVINDPVFVIPADGATVNHSAPFAGTDPVHSADQLIGVPEPSIALLGALGVLGLIRRRR